MKAILIAVQLFCLTLAGPVRAETYDPVPDLLNAFGSGCAMGPFSQKTLSQATALQRVLQSMRDDPACTALASAMAGFQDAVTTVNQLIQHPIIKDSKGRSEAIMNELMIIYNQLQPNDVMKSSIGEQIVRIRMENLELTQQQKYETSTSFYQGVRDLSKYVQSVFTNLQGTSECLNKRPNLAIQLLGQLVGVSSSFLSYPLAPGAFMFGQTIEGLINLFHKGSYNVGIKEIQQARLSSALSCVVESLASNYCEARDAEVLNRARQEQQHGHPVLRAG
jgi:hypothetical protein